MTEKLPAILQEIADVAGEAAAMAIAAHAGGTRAYFPAQPTQDHWLALTIGLAPAMKLCQHFAVGDAGKQRGTHIAIPLYVGGTYQQYLRAVQKRIHELDTAGLSASEIARKVGTTDRAVHRARAKHRGGRRNDRQRSLF